MDEFAKGFEAGFRAGHAAAVRVVIRDVVRAAESLPMQIPSSSQARDALNEHLLFERRHRATADQCDRAVQGQRNPGV